MFNHQVYNKIFIDNYKAGKPPLNNSKCTIIPEEVEPGQPIYKILGIHHLSPAENVGKHHLFLECLDENGNRDRRQLVEWFWEGQRPDQLARPVVLDKPDNEPAGNIAIGSNQKIWAFVRDQTSDMIGGVHTLYPDEPGPPPGANTIGHHSFYVVWMRIKAAEVEEPPPIPTNCEELEEIVQQLTAENVKLENAISEISHIIEGL